MTVRDDQKLQIQQATDIVRLVGEDLALKPKGREFVCLCPFHDDRRPSMTVVPAKQIFHCFVCGAGGDAFGWLMKYHKMTFPEALRHLADRAGIKLEQRAGLRDQGSAQQEQTDRELIKAANQRALGFFQAMLRHADHGRGAREYLKHRGISGEMVEAFQLGYAPDRWDGLVTTIRDKSWNRRSFELAGLISARPTGQGHYDKLRHRLIFPICDSIGRPIAFGGRVLPGGTLEDKNEAKYLNTAETPLFNKSATLYGLHLAKSAPGGIIGGRTAVIVEGYTDVIAAHQAGARDVVATLGTALTSRHVTELRRYAEKVVLVFDADEAGQKAADRAVEVFLAGALDVAIAVLPDGRDPAELLATENGRQRWQDVIDIAADALTYQFERVRRQMEAATTVTGRQRLVEDYLRKLAGLGLARMGIIRRSLVIQRLAELLHLPEATLAGLLKRLAPAAGRTPPGGPTPSSAEPPPQGADNRKSDVVGTDAPHRISRFQHAERELIGSLLHQPRLFHHTLSDGRTVAEAVVPAQMVTDAGRRLYQSVYTRLSEGTELTLSGLLSDLAEHGETALAELATLAEAEVEQHSQSNEERVKAKLAAAAELILRYHRDQQHQKTKAALAEQVMHAVSSDGADHAQAEQLQRQFGEYLKAHSSPDRIARVSGGQ